MIFQSNLASVINKNDRKNSSPTAEHLIFKIDSLTKESEELETKDAVQISSIKAKNFIHSQEFLSQNFDSDQLKNMKSKMFSAVAQKQQLED